MPKSHFTIRITCIVTLTAVLSSQTAWGRYEDTLRQTQEGKSAQTVGDAIGTQLPLEDAERIAIAIRSLDHGLATNVLMPQSVFESHLYFLMKNLKRINSSDAAIDQMFSEWLASSKNCRNILYDIILEVKITKKRLAKKHEYEQWLKELITWRDTNIRLRDGLIATYDNINKIIERSSKSRFKVSAKKLLNEALENIQKAAAIIENRVRFVKNEVERKPIDLKKLFDDILKKRRSRAKYDPNYTVPSLHNISGKPIILYGDRISLYNAFANLLANAYKYSWATEIFITIGEQDGFAVVSIGDKGSGIPVEFMQKDGNSVEAMFRLNTTEDKKYGTGLGTTETRYAILDHGGTITVESEVGIGTTFTIRLPIVEPVTEEDKNLIEAVKGKLNVIVLAAAIIEPDKVNRERLETELKSYCGFGEVLAVESLTELKQMLQEEKYQNLKFTLVVDNRDDALKKADESFDFAAMLLDKLKGLPMLQITSQATDIRKPIRDHLRSI